MKRVILDLLKRMNDGDHLKGFEHHNFQAIKFKLVFINSKIGHFLILHKVRIPKHKLFHQKLKLWYDNFHKQKYELEFPKKL